MKTSVLDSIMKASKARNYQSHVYTDSSTQRGAKWRNYASESGGSLVNIKGLLWGSEDQFRTSGFICELRTSESSSEVRRDIIKFRRSLFELKRSISCEVWRFTMRSGGPLEEPQGPLLDPQDHLWGLDRFMWGLEGHLNDPDGLFSGSGDHLLNLGGHFYGFYEIVWSFENLCKNFEDS